MDIIWNGPNGFISDIQNPGTTQPGQYFITVTDTLTGCTSSDSINVISNYDYPIIDIDSAHNCDGTITLSALVSSNSSTLSIYWEGPSIISDNTLSDIIVDSEGFYSLEVIDEETGCFSYISIEIQGLDCAVGILESPINDDFLIVFPNPTNRYLNINSIVRFNKVVIVNELGILVKSIEDYELLDLKNLENGIYYLGVIKANQVNWRLIIKSH